MLKIILTMLLLMTLSMGSFAEESVEFTGGAPNGRWWNASTEGSKTFYLVGLRDGLLLTQKINQFWASGFIIGAYMKELTKLYDATENVRIPIYFVFGAVTRKLKGELSREQFETRLANLRELYNDTTP